MPDKALSDLRNSTLLVFPEFKVMEDLVVRLRKRAEIRLQISTRKSFTEGKPDRLAELLLEAVEEIERLTILSNSSSSSHQNS